MRNIREVVQLSTEFLEKKGVQHARREAGRAFGNPSE